MNFGSTEPHLPSVAVLMSGGVDSSVAAAMLVEAGHRVVGLTLKLWDAENDEHARKVCCTKVMARDAGRVCAQLSVPHYTIDLREDFNREVIERFESDYLAGRTPNPCVHCNSKVKWGRAWEKACALGIDRIATGHYARIERSTGGEVHLRRGIDESKDQSYFLWEIPKNLLDVTMFPLGATTKAEVRGMARKLGLAVAEKEESQEVCFIPRDDYRGWLMSRRSELASGSMAGEIVDESGSIIGNHDGYPLFTVGQRKGLGLGGGRKLFVTRIEPRTKRVHVGPVQEENNAGFRIGNVNRLADAQFDGRNGYSAKIRYRDPGFPVRVTSLDRDQLLVKSDTPVRSVTPGQSAVIYSGDQVVAGGIIL